MPVICQLCNKSFESQITNSHLRHVHNTTTADYKTKFGNNSLSSVEYKMAKSIKAAGRNNPMFGKTHTTKTRDIISSKNLGKTAHNKGTIVNDEKHLQNIHIGIAAREERYKLNNYHPKLGKSLSDTTRNKISTGVSKYAKDNPDKVASRTKKIVKTKSINGTLHLGYFGGKTHSVETKSKISNTSKLTGARKHIDAMLSWTEFLNTINITITSTHDNIATCLCNVCKCEFTVTTQYFSKSKQRTDLCPKCRAPTTHSKGELELYSFVSSINTGNTLLGNRTAICPLELDIYCPDKNLAIEYCGLYWHSELQGKTHDYHLTKHNLCKEKNIQLITVFEDEWLNKQDIVKSRLSHMFGISSTVIGARQCSISYIDSAAGTKFLNDNHIQGVGRNNIYIGLVHNNELVSLMTFAKSNISKGGTNKPSEYELNRFCNKLNYSIPGAASRLFSEFVKTYKPEWVFSYADKRWSIGNLYSNIGFEQVKDSPPGYWYISGSERLHRYSLRKTLNDDQNLTEWENRQIQGWDRIWDCGNTKWVWPKK